MRQDRPIEAVIDSPLEGDCIEITEDGIDKMLRVLAVVEGWVWFKEYGEGYRPSLPIGKWRTRISQSIDPKVLLFK